MPLAQELRLLPSHSDLPAFLAEPLSGFSRVGPGILALGYRDTNGLTVLYASETDDLATFATGREAILTEARRLGADEQFVCFLPMTPSARRSIVAAITKFLQPPLNEQRPEVSG